MEELLQAPTKGVGDAIVVPAVLANQFELRVGLLNLVTAISFHGAAQTWLEKEPPNSITTWDDLVSKFVNQFFPPSRTTSLRNDITNFQKKYSETFSVAWERFKDLLKKCAHHEFSPLHQIDTFYNGLNQSDQDSLNSAASGNFSSQNDAITALTKQVKALGKHIAAMQKPVHSIQESCETCGGPHHYSECQATSSFTQGEVYATTRNYNTGVPPPNPSSSSKEVERDPETTMDQLHISSPESTTRVPSPIIQPAFASKPNEIPESNPHQPPIPYPSRLNKEKL
ncbi:reverse transcriptase domain-containing protein [Tanacetum coccineum]